MARINDNVSEFIDNLGKEQPHNVECEEVVIGSILKDNNLINHVSTVLEVDDLYAPLSKVVYGGILSLYAKNSVITPILLHEEIKKTGNTVITLESLQELEHAADTAGIQNYLEVLMDKSKHRQLGKILTKSLSMAGDGIISARDLFERTSSALFDLFSKSFKEDFQRVDVVGTNVLEHVQTISENTSGLSGLTTGYVYLDKMTAGLQKGNLVIIAARPSVGKSSLGMCIARNASVNANAPVAVFSLEMSKEELVQRMLASEGRVDAQKIRNGELTANEWKRLAYGLSTLAKADVYLDDTPLITPMQLRAKCKKLQFELMLQGKRLELVVIDYIQLMSASKKIESRQQEITTISRELKALAKELDCPVIVMSQLNRNPEKREDPRPKLSDLRESGAIEQDADVVLFIYREEQIQALPVNAAQAEIIIAKQRMGPTGIIILGWQKKYTRFENAFPEEMKEFTLT